MLRIERFESGAFQAPAAAEKLNCRNLPSLRPRCFQKGFAEGLTTESMFRTD